MGSLVNIDGPTNHNDLNKEFQEKGWDGVVKSLRPDNHVPDAVEAGRVDEVNLHLSYDNKRGSI